MNPVTEEEVEKENLNDKYFENCCGIDGVSSCVMTSNSASKRLFFSKYLKFQIFIRVIWEKLKISPTT